MANRRDTDDDAPWLAEASPRAETRVTKRSFFWTLAILLALAAVAAIGLVMLMSKKSGGSAQGYMEASQAPLITAEPGPYKVPPTDPKGMAVEGQDQTIYAAGQGIDSGSVIDQSATPETPMPRPGSEAPAAPTAPPPGPPRNLVPEITSDTRAATTETPPKPLTAKPVSPPIATVLPPKTTAAPTATPPKTTVSPPITPPKPAIPAPKPAAAAVAAPAVVNPKTPEIPAKTAAPPVKKASTAQLGAFSSAEKADAAWAALAGKPGMAGFGKRVVRIESNGQTLYRLRASGGDATALCASLKAAGQPCAIVE